MTVVSSPTNLLQISATVYFKYTS